MRIILTLQMVLEMRNEHECLCYMGMDKCSLSGRINRSVAAYGCWNILENVLLPSVRRIYTEEDIPTFRLVQDNSAVHTAHIVKEWFVQHPEIEVFDWPTKSLDFNLIENIWEIIANLWVFGHESTKEHLVAHVRNSCEKLRYKPQNILKI
jgi:hypothetical protein